MTLSLNVVDGVDALDLDLSVAFKTALKSLGDVAEFQRSQYMSLRVAFEMRSLRAGRESAGNRRSFEEFDEVLQLQRIGNTLHATVALVGVEIDRAPQFGQGRAPLASPVDCVKSLARPAHRQIMTNYPEGEIVGHDIWTRQEEEHAGPDEPEGIDDQPEPVLFEITSELAAKQVDRSVLFEVVRKK